MQGEDACGAAFQLSSVLGCASGRAHTGWLEARQLARLGLLAVASAARSAIRNSLYAIWLVRRMRQPSSNLVQGILFADAAMADFMLAAWMRMVDRARGRATGPLLYAATLCFQVGVLSIVLRTLVTVSDRTVDTLSDQD